MKNSLPMMKKRMMPVRISAKEWFRPNTLDLSAVPLIHEKTHLPIVVDPSHATGKANLVEPMMIAAVAAGADGLMIEVHNNPAKAKCDGAQSLTPDQFDELMGFITKEVEFFGKKMN